MLYHIQVEGTDPFDLYNMHGDKYRTSCTVAPMVLVIYFNLYKTHGVI